MPGPSGVGRLFAASWDASSFWTSATPRIGAVCMGWMTKPVLDPGAGVTVPDEPVPYSAARSPRYPAYCGFVSRSVNMGVRVCAVVATAALDPQSTGTTVGLVMTGPPGCLVRWQSGSGVGIDGMTWTRVP